MQPSLQRIKWQISQTRGASAGVSRAEILTQKTSPEQTAVFVSHFLILGHSLGKEDTMLLYKGHSSPLFELPTSEPPGKNVSHPFVKIKISFCRLQYAMHILSSRGQGEATITKEALARRRGSALPYRGASICHHALSHCFHMLLPLNPGQKHSISTTLHTCAPQKTLILQNLQMPPAGVIP